MLSTLQQAGWVRSLGDRSGWTLGPKLLTLTGVTDHMSLQIMREELNELSRKTGFVVFIAEPDGSGRYVVITKAERRLGVRVTVGIGEQFEFSAPALMNAFHAWEPVEKFDAAVKRSGVNEYTEYTVTSPEELHAELERTRKRGFSISLQQFDIAQSGVAAPIFDRNGKVSHVICSLAFSSELDAENAESIGALLAECANRITETTGGKFPS